MNLYRMMHSKDVVRISANPFKLSQFSSILIVRIVPRLVVKVQATGPRFYLVKRAIRRVQLLAMYVRVHTIFAMAQ